MRFLGIHGILKLTDSQLVWSLGSRATQTYTLDIACHLTAHGLMQRMQDISALQRMQDISALQAKEVIWLKPRYQTMEDISAPADCWKNRTRELLF